MKVVPSRIKKDITKKEIFKLSKISGIKVRCCLCYELKETISIEDNNWNNWNICLKCFEGDKNE